MGRHSSENPPASYRQVIADQVDRALPQRGRDLYGHASGGADRLYDRIGKAGIPAENVARVVARAYSHQAKGTFRRGARRQIVPLAAFDSACLAGRLDHGSQSGH
jgi:hypothetical protein